MVDIVSKKFTEASYLCTDNASRYRVIMRMIYNEYEKMKFWLYKEDIFEGVSDKLSNIDYNLDKLKQDLDSLEGWGNLITVQDAGKVRSLEEFKNRRFRYQISPNSIEIERMMIKIENMNTDARGSLEVSLMERLKSSLKDIKDIEDIKEDKAFELWNNLNQDFIRLNDNYKDYISSFYSPKSEELLKTAQFLIFKESFTKYLRDFIKGLLKNAEAIKDIIVSTPESKINTIIKLAVQHERNIATFNNDFDEEEKLQSNKEKYFSIREWFLGSDDSQCMLENIIQNTNEIIRKITSFALQIMDLENGGGNRKEEYKTIISLFEKCSDINEAHKLSSAIFGVLHPRNLVLFEERISESAESSVYEEPTEVRIVVPRTNTYREKSVSRVKIKDKTNDKKRQTREILERREKEKELITKRIKDGKIAFKDLDNISKEERLIFLRWLSLGLSKKGKKVKNEYGQYFTIGNLDTEERISISCVDGDFTMPAYEIMFVEGDRE